MCGYESREPRGSMPSVVYFGTGDLGIQTLDALILNKVSVKLIVTAPDRPAGRGLRIKTSVIKDLALRADIPVLQPADVNDPYIMAHIREAGCGLGLIIAYGQKIGVDLIESFPQGIINLHASLLPKYRGAAPVNWTIINGERRTGLTVMQINERIDAGTILARRGLEIDPLERADELHDRLAGLGPELVLEVINQIRQGTLQPVSQDPEAVTHAPKLKKSLSEIDWRVSAEKLANVIRGLWPWPAAKSWYLPQTGKPVEVSLARAKVSETSPDAPADGPAGTILADFSVACERGRIELLELRPAGGRLITWQEFINGRHVQPGDRFSTHAPVETEDS